MLPGTLACIAAPGARAPIGAVSTAAADGTIADILARSSCDLFLWSFPGDEWHPCALDALGEALKPGVVAAAPSVLEFVAGERRPARPRDDDDLRGSARPVLRVLSLTETGMRMWTRAVFRRAALEACYDVRAPSSPEDAVWLAILLRTANTGALAPVSEALVAVHGTDSAPPAPPARPSFASWRRNVASTWRGQRRVRHALRAAVPGARGWAFRARVAAAQVRRMALVHLTRPAVGIVVLALRRRK